MIKGKNFIFFSIISIILLTITLATEPRRNGDGHEYSLTAKAFLNHLTPNITDKDVADRWEDIKEFNSKDYIPEYFEKIKNGIVNKESNAGRTGIFRNNNGDYNGYHFWFYPLLASGSEVLLSLFKLNPLKSFQLVNAIVLIFALYLLAFKENKNYISQFIFLAGGVIFYLKWTHPEVMIYTFLFLSFYYLINNKTFLCALFISLASIQVVSLCLLFVVVPIYISWRDRKNLITVSVGLLKDWKIWLCGFIALTSIFFYYWKFGQFSLIGTNASKLSNINIGHFISYYFDLDQGVWVGAPWFILILLFVKWRSSKNISRDFVFSLIFSVVICIPLMANNGMNAGQSVFQRYALYSISPLIAWCCVYSSEILNNIYKITVTFTLAIIYIMFYKGYMIGEDYISHKPWTQYILENYPAVYNPEPQIFIMRTFPPSDWISGMQDSYAYKNKDGIITKIIYQASNDKLLSDICSGQIKDFATHQPINYSNASASKYGWRYISGEMYCDGFVPYKGYKYSEFEPNQIDFTKKGLPEFVLGISGISQEEAWGRWSQGNEIQLNLSTNLNKSMIFYVELIPFGPNIGKKITIKVNNEERVLLPVEGKENTFYAKFDFQKIADKATVKIIVPNPISPFKLGMSNDTREIGLGLIKMYWEQIVR